MTVVVAYDLALPTQQTYITLQASLNNWLNRSDLTALIPDFIALAEERLNRILRVRQMETSLVDTPIASNAINLPAGTVGVKSVWVKGYERFPLKAQSLDFVKSRPAFNIPTVYARQGDTLVFDGTGTVAGVLYKRIPSLSGDNTVNWLVTDAPSAYLYGAMREAFDYLRDDVERDRWAARLQGVIDEINGAEMRDAYNGALQIRPQ